VNAAKKNLIWDVPTRLFHWLLVVLIALQYATAEFHFLDMDWHFRFGYATLALILFRLLWGVFGSQTSRFSEFLRGPSAVIDHARALFSTNPHVSIGHNPLGGWSVVVLLLCVTIQAITGPFASDGIDTDGPFVDRVSSAASHWCTRIHDWNQNVLLALIALHVLAIVLYRVLRNADLLSAMITGRSGVDAPSLRFAGIGRALFLFGLCAAAVAALIVWGTR
jgi:cytochrome b